MGLIDADKNENSNFNDPMQGFTFDNESYQPFHI